MIFLWCAQQATATRFVVGDAAGWTSFDPQLGKAPDYAAWAASHMIFINDTLLFDMPQAHQTLDQLFTQQDFDSCNFTISRNWANYTDTSFEARLTEPGYYFFSSSLPNHCVNGQKLRVIVLRPASPPFNSQGPTQSPQMAPYAGPAMSPHVSPAGFPVLSPHLAPGPSPSGSPFKAPAPSTVPPVSSQVSISLAPGPSQVPSGAPPSSNVTPDVVILMTTLAALLLL